MVKKYLMTGTLPSLLSLMKSDISTGVSVTARNDENSMANVFVYAKGLNNLPACSCNVNTGRNPTVITSKEKKSDGPTSLAASIITSVLLQYSSRLHSHCSIFLWAFSTMMIEASTIAPIAIAMPLRLMIFEVTPRKCIQMNEIMIATGRVSITTRALGRWNRNIMHTALTAIESLAISSLRVLID